MDGKITKTFKVRKNINGKQKEVTIGSFPEISYEKAVKEKNRIIKELAKE